jgi:hypothetical protein
MTTAAVLILMILAVHTKFIRVFIKSVDENSYTSALMITMMTMLSGVQLCWCPNSVLHLSQLSR